MSVVSRVWSAGAGCPEPAEGPLTLRSGWQWASEKTQPGPAGVREHQDGSEEGVSRAGSRELHGAPEAT